MRVVCKILLATVIFTPMAACHSPSHLPADVAAPEWLRKEVSRGRRLPVIEQVNYKEQPAFNTTATDRFDTGDEHSLFSADGRLICRYGGYVGRVASGSCDMDKIVHIRTLYEPPKG